MNTGELSGTLAALLSELAHGASEQPHMLNRGDLGLLGSLDKLSARQASVDSTGGASIAAHVDHLRYGLSLLNRWSAGERPFETANWTASWRIKTVSDAEWLRLREGLANEVRQWIDVLKAPRDVSDVELGDLVGSIAHFAYHVSAIRQIDRAAGGPAESA